MKHFKAYSGTFYYAAIAMGQGDRYREEAKGIDPNYTRKLEGRF